MNSPSLGIVVTHKANADETAIYKYISEKFGIIYADKFRKKLVELLRLISSQPFIGRPAKNDSSIRVFLMSRQNKIVYRLTETEIVILRIINTKTKSSGNF
jgi:plasmid stabilization system protein ParE